MSGQRWAYYNEHDAFAAAWLRELIAENLIAPGEVDERSIEDVTPNELRSFRQCHFFAGIGIWSLAARRAGWRDDEALWSGSCPCQPFSVSGKGGGFDDERHLWPAFFHLIEQCQPALVVGEQVAGADGDAWLDLVSSDLDAAAYAFGAVETVACGFGAPHKRSRNYWLADRISARLERHPGHGERGHQSRWIGTDEARSVAAGCIPDRLADGGGIGRERGQGPAQGSVPDGADAGRFEGDHGSIGRDEAGTDRLADDTEQGRRRLEARDDREDGRAPPELGRLRVAVGHNRGPGPTNGLWGSADWLRCRDEKWRPVEPGTFPLVDAGAFRNRVGLLRGAGNAITLGQAQGFLEAVRKSLR